MRASYTTRPREQIASVLRSERRFLSAAEIFHALEERGIHVSLSTVYRTLEHLLAKREATVRVDDAGESTYTVCEPEHYHHHAICTKCGRVEDVECGAVDQFVASARTPNGFVIDSHRLEFNGRCRDCS